VQKLISEGFSIPQKSRIVGNIRKASFIVQSSPSIYTVVLTALLSRINSCVFTSPETDILSVSLPTPFQIEAFCLITYERELLTFVESGYFLTEFLRSILCLNNIKMKYM